MAANIEVGSSIVQQIVQSMLHSNAYMEKLCLLRDQPPGVSYAFELKNQPSTSTEIAAVIHSNSIANSSPRSVHVCRNYPTPKEGEFVDILSSHYEPLQYPLLLLHASLGWSNKFFPKLTQMKYYPLDLLQNHDHFCFLGRLNNGYLVDMFSQMDDECSQYRHQGLINRAGGDKDIDYHVGPTCIGSKAGASEQIADLLALCHQYGRPALFITVTTNSNWPEIREHLYPGQNASVQPGVVARAFQACFSFMMMAIS